MSLAESKICKPLVKPTKAINVVVLVLLTIDAISIGCMVGFDLILVKLPPNGSKSPKKPFITILFVGLFAAIILYLSSGSFNQVFFVP